MAAYSSSDTSIASRRPVLELSSFASVNSFLTSVSMLSSTSGVIGSKTSLSSWSSHFSISKTIVTGFAGIVNWLPIILYSVSSPTIL